MIEVQAGKMDCTWEATHDHSSSFPACTPRSPAFSSLKGPICLRAMLLGLPVCSQCLNGSFGRFSFPSHFDQRIYTNVQFVFYGMSVAFAHSDRRTGRK